MVCDLCRGEDTLDCLCRANSCEIWLDPDLLILIGEGVPDVLKETGKRGGPCSKKLPGCSDVPVCCECELLDDPLEVFRRSWF